MVSAGSTIGHFLDRWCVVKTFNSRLLAAVYLTIMSAIGYVAYRSITDYFRQLTEPAVATVLSAEVVRWPGQRAELIIKVHSPESPNCVRERQITMEYKDEDGTVHYYPLGSARNGLGAGRAGVYYAHYDLPPWIPLGSLYLDRVTYTCPIWPFLSTIRQYTAPEMPLPLPHGIRN